ncbi:anaphase-promoting complex subunit 4-like [Rutidosis leptorrhynchoides]|uniref:anaphase-promoting complex subunit 4-like n=1 Tax=Rutidosis leptorrhynchoides TaxID=125765 RepID=UPI003A99A3A0
METDDEDVSRILPFQLQFDKPVASQIKIAEWNPEKDLLAMVTDDSKILLHRFNWQRLWTISPGRCITSLCWRPDGKAIAVGLQDGTISLHDVENGKLLRSMKSHAVAVVCLNWEDDGGQDISDENFHISKYEDRTSRFFPTAPRAPRAPGVVPGETGFMDENENLSLELSNSSYQRFNILCGADKDGIISFSIFGIFPIGKIDIHDVNVKCPLVNTDGDCKLLNASICKVGLSKDLCHLTVLCCGELRGHDHELHGFHLLTLDTSIFYKRRNELHQIAQQASNIEDLTEVIRSSLSVMTKQWSDAMHTFHDKFHPLTSLIHDHGLDSTPQEEFLSLLGGARTSPAVHQFLVNSLGELGLKRITKSVSGAGKEVQVIVLEHLQPAAEMIGFRLGELRGLSKWRSRYAAVGLDETLIDNATEKASMLLIQVERLMSVLSSSIQQFSNFFIWLKKCVRMLMSEPNDQNQLLAFNSELVILFLKYLYDEDPVRRLLESTESDNSIEVDLHTMERVQELARFGGFTDVDFLRRTLMKEFQQMESCFKEAFQMPFTAISKKILCQNLLPLFPVKALPKSALSTVPTSISYYMEASQAGSMHVKQNSCVNYVSFRLPDEGSSNLANCVVVTRCIMNALEAVLLRVPDGYHCVDLSLYKERQLVVLLNRLSSTSDNSEKGCMMIVQADDLPFVSIPISSASSPWKLHQLKDPVLHLEMDSFKVRGLPHSVMAPLAVSASRGVACVFATRKRALVYILDEDEDEISDAE